MNLDMTLILTELSKFGIAMATDSAITYPSKTPDGEFKNRVFEGLRKLFPIPKLKAGISFWGYGDFQDVYLDDWLKNFIEKKEPQYNSLKDFAILLQDELRKKISEINPEQEPEGTHGFHLAGYVDYKNRNIPTLWHIHNGYSTNVENIDPKLINANYDVPPEKYIEFERIGYTLILRNGNIGVHKVLFEKIKELFDFLHKDDILVFYPPSLETRARFLRFLIKTTEGVVNLTNEIHNIGGNIETLTISPKGEINYNIPEIS